MPALMCSRAGCARNSPRQGLDILLLAPRACSEAPADVALSSAPSRCCHKKPAYSSP
jgi:hypothetical protein